MLEKIKYVNHIGEEISFGSGNGIYVNYNDLRDFKYVLSTNNNRIRGAKRSQVVTKKLPIVISVKENEDEIKNNLYEIFAKDTVNNKYGRIYIGDCYYECFMSGSKKADYLISKGYLKVDIDVSTDRPYWIREIISKDFDPEGITTNVVGKAVVGYACVSGSVEDIIPESIYDDETKGASIKNTHFTECDCEIIIYGEAENPYITIGENVYNIKVDVAAGERLRINTKRKEIILIHANGTEENVFMYRNKENNPYEKIKTGFNRVLWNGDFAISVTLFEERDEALWI